MFALCTSLTTAPELPATELAESCYSDMFSGCTSLTTVPALLPATTLASSCYRSMFEDCTGLTTTPELPATTLAESCYSNMFNDCSNLNYIKMLATDISASSCLSSWVSGVSSTGTFVKNANMTSLPSGSSGIPSGWTVVNDVENISDPYFTIEALEDGLTASLSNNVCEYRIDDGSWITLSDDTDTPSINKGQTLSFKGNLALSSGYGIGTFTISERCNLKGNIMSLLYGDDFIGQNDFSEKDYAFFELFYYCEAIVDVSELILPATTLSIGCYASMFEGCSNLTTAPKLPATTLVTNCYHGMFYDCSNLNKITMLATDISADRCLYNWVSGVSSTGTFVKHPDMNSLPTGEDGIPEGWTVEDYVERNLITFTIDGVEYQAEEGMTWGEWVDTPYNTLGLINQEYTDETGEVFYAAIRNPIIDRTLGYNYDNTDGTDGFGVQEAYSYEEIRPNWIYFYLKW